jgi:phage host-nuclease inhibitor protein Gam
VVSAPTERLHDHLTSVHEVDVEQEIKNREIAQQQPGLVIADRFIVDDDDKANWALRKLAKTRAAIEEIDEAAVREQERISQWRVTETTKLIRQAQFFEGLLGEFHRLRLSVDPKAKTVNLPAGKLKSRAGSDVWEFDTEKFIEWAATQERFIRTKVEIDRAGAKKALKPKGGKVIDPETGEVVPGVDVIPGERKFTVEVSE